MDILKEDLPEFIDGINQNKDYEYYLTNDNIKYERIKMGSENEFFKSIGMDEYYSELYEREYCHDCLAKIGEYHLFEYLCDLEVCPVCGEQILSCGCIKNIGK